jgi:hypothetical protein
MITLDEYIEAERDMDVRESRLGWKIHAAVYGIVNAVLIVINLLVVANTDEDFLWFPFPLVCGGFGLAAHYLFGVRMADRTVRDHQMKVQRLAERKLAM